jgi:NAD(P)-dependent dehydrogenase (short-subunit alcohol dehydrogenase family)
MTARFTGQNVLVTGGGAGLGQAIALAFAAEQATVVVAGRTPEPLRHTVALIEDRGGRATAVTADVTRPAEVAGLVGQAAAAYGRLDVAVNNAGTLTAVGPVGDIDEAQWSALVAVNLTGALLSMKHEIAYMRRHGGGAIVNVASSLGAYVATKAAVSALTRNAARDHIGEGIRINAVSPGPSDTPMSLRPGETLAERDARLRDALPAGRVGERAEIAAAVLYLASADAQFIVGTDLVVDGGATA